MKDPPVIGRAKGVVAGVGQMAWKWTKFNGTSVRSISGGQKERESGTNGLLLALWHHTRALFHAWRMAAYLFSSESLMTCWVVFLFAGMEDVLKSSFRSFFFHNMCTQEYEFSGGFS